MAPGFPRMQLAVVTAAGTNLQTDSFRLGPYPKLPGSSGHLLAGKAAAAEILGWPELDQSGSSTIAPRPILAAP